MKKCSNCGYDKLNGTEAICPQCNYNLVYKCKKCGKELINGKRAKCPLCIYKTKRLIGVILSVLGLLSSVPGALLSALYFALPTDFITDVIPGVGFLDDILIIAGVVLLSGGLTITGIVLLVWAIIAIAKISEKKTS